MPNARHVGLFGVSPVAKEPAELISTMSKYPHPGPALCTTTRSGHCVGIEDVSPGGNSVKPACEMQNIMSTSRLPVCAPQSTSHHIIQMYKTNQKVHSGTSTIMHHTYPGFSTDAYHSVKQWFLNTVLTPCVAYASCRSNRNHYPRVLTSC